MDGSVYLGGGGAAEEERVLWDEMLRGRTNVLYWPFALDGKPLGGADGWLRGNLARRWPGVRLTTWHSLEGREPEELNGFDLLFVGGGNTFLLLEQVASRRFIEPVRRYVASGGAYYGGSAGAVLACDDIGIAAGHDDNRAGLEQLAGLALVPGVAVLPHYTSAAEATARSWHATSGRTVVGIPERSGVIFDAAGARVAGEESVRVLEDGVITVFGPGESLPLGPILPSGREPDGRRSSQA